MSRRWLTMFVVLLFLMAACTSTGGKSASSGDKDASSDKSSAKSTDPGSQRGINDSEINIALAYGDTRPLQGTGLVPDVGDTEQNLQVFVDKANDEGLFGGRTVNVQFVPIPVPSSASDQLAACIAVTQDRENFFVIVPGGILESTMSCITAEHETILMMLGGAYTDELFDVSEGRLFDNQMGVGRLFEAAVRAYASQGRLKGKTIGIVRTNDPQDDEAAAELEKALEAKNFKVTEDVALVCESLSCEGVDSAVERLRTSGVDAVFSLLAFPEYPSFVSAAGNAGFTPDWFASDYQNQTTESTAQFMQNAAKFYDGAIGTTTNLRESAPDAARQKCNDYFTQATGVTYEPLSDAWKVVGNFCEMIERSARVVDKIEADGLKVGQNTFIKYMEKESVQSGENSGQFGPGKHDAYDTTATIEFVADCHAPDKRGITVCWKEIPGSRTKYGK